MPFHGVGHVLPLRLRIAVWLPGPGVSLSQPAFQRSLLLYYYGILIFQLAVFVMLETLRKIYTCPSTNISSTLASYSSIIPQLVSYISAGARQCVVLVGLR
jgi:hypothetical protein